MLYGAVADPGGVAGVDVCQDDFCTPANLLPSAPTTELQSAATSGRWSATTEATGDAFDYVSQTFDFYAQDDAGNRTPDPLSLTVWIDNVAPVVTVTRTVSEILLDDTQTVLWGTATDGGEVSAVYVTVQSPTGEQTTGLAQRDGVAWQVDLTANLPGAYKLWANAIDLADNDTSVGPFVVNVSCLAATAGVSALSAEPTDGTPNKLTLVAEINNSEGVQLAEGWPVDFYVDGVLVGSGATSRVLDPGEVDVLRLTTVVESASKYGISARIRPGGQDSGLPALCRMPQVAEQVVTILDVPLTTSWNLISTYVEPFNPAIEVVQRPISGTYATILSYDQGDLVYQPDQPPTGNTLQKMDAAHAYWIRSSVETTSTLWVVGQPLTADRPLALNLGWNAVSYLPRTGLTVDEALASIQGKVTAVLGFDQGALGYYPDLDASFNTLDQMEPLHGYWIQVTEPVSLTYPVTQPVSRTVSLSSSQARTNGVRPTYLWTNFYGPAETADGERLSVGTVVQAVDPQGVICGVSVVTTPGQYGLLACYGDDPDTGVDEGAQPGDAIRFVVDGITLATGEWTENRQRAWVPLGDVQINRIFFPLFQQHATKQLYLPMIAKPQLATATPTPGPTPTAESGADNFVGDVVAGLTHPNGVAVHQGQNRLFLTSRDNNQLLKVNPVDNTVVATAATGDQPWGVVVNETTNRVYVSNYASADVWVYDADTLARLAVIKLGNPGEVQPGLMAVLPDLDTVAVTLQGVNGVALIQGLTLGPIIGSTGVSPFGLAVDPVRNRIFVSNRDGGNMRVLYRTEFGQWKNDGQNFTFGDRRIPFEVEYNPVNQKLYLLYVVDTAWSVDVWEIRADDWFWKVATIPVGQSGSSRDPNVGGMGLAVDTATGNVFVANSVDNTVSVINGSSNQVTRTLATGPDPFQIAVNPVTRMVYVVLRQVNRLAFFRDVY